MQGLILLSCCRKFSGGYVIRRVLFVTFTSYLDDANGASVASRAMMEALARRGFAVEALCGPILELDRGIDPASALAARGLAVEAQGRGARDIGRCEAQPVTADHLHLNIRGVPIIILAGSTQPHPPDEVECRAFLELFEQTWARLQAGVVVS
jgi:hypothetical protein